MHITVQREFEKVKRYVLENFFDTFLNAYTITSQGVFPMLIFIIILLVIDLGKYSKFPIRFQKKITICLIPLKIRDLKKIQMKIT
ncbi:MAG: hypothetical protein Ct9H90mP18_03660 [Gammaproteobacteria bacterium]|nr:MAG: hypothetical protein Ct9H90mP18_03660 [Gammaproteobacteria bacterium]